MSLCQPETPHHGRREADNHIQHYRLAETFSIQLLVEARLNPEFYLGPSGWPPQMRSVPSLAGREECALFANMCGGRWLKTKLARLRTQPTGSRIAAEHDSRSKVRIRRSQSPHRFAKEE